MGTVRISAFRSSPATTFEIEADVVAQEAGNNRSLVRVFQVARCGPGGSTGSFFSGTGTQRWWSNTDGGASHGPVSPFMPSGVPNGVERWREQRDYWLNHDGNGNASLQFGMNVTYPPNTDGDGDDYFSGVFSAARIPAAPGAPGTPVVSGILPTSCTLTWAAAARGHADITTYQYQIATDPGFGFTVGSPMPGVVTTRNTLSDLTLAPGTRYYVRVRAWNSDGWGAWSGTATFETLAGGRAWDGTSWRNCRVRYWNGTAWQNCRVRQWDGSTWRNTR